MNFSLHENMAGFCSDGHKLFKSIGNKDVPQHIFSYRVINNWNSLPDVIVNASTLSQFNHLIDSNNTHTHIHTHTYTHNVHNVDQVIYTDNCLLYLLLLLLLLLLHKLLT